MDRLNEYRSVFVYRWRIVLLAWLLLAAALCAIVHVIPSTYLASTTILDYPRKVPEKYVTATVADDPADRLALLQQEILSSTRLLEVISKFGLYRKLIESEGRDAAVREFRKQIKIQTSHGPSNGPSAFTLTFTGDDPKIVAAVTNELANSFIFKNLANRQQQVRGTVSFISDQLDQAKSELQGQEDGLRVFRMGHLGEMPDQVTTNLQAISQLQVQYQSISDKLAQLDEEKFLIESAPEADPALRVYNAPSPESILSTELNQEKAHLASLLTHLTPEHPDVLASQARVKALSEQLQMLPKAPSSPSRTHGADARLQVLEQQRQHLLTEQASIRTRLNSYQNKVDAVPLRQEQLSSLTRDYDTARDHYRSLLEKYYSAEMASQLEEKQDADRFEALDPAVAPEHPSSPNRPLLYAVSGGVALVVSFLLAFGLEHLDGSIKSESELLRILPNGMEFVGVICNIAPAPTNVPRRLFEGI